MVALDDIIRLNQDKTLDFKVVRTATGSADIQALQSGLTSQMSNPVSATSRHVTNYRSITRKRPASEIQACNQSNSSRAHQYKKKAPISANESDRQHVSEFQKVLSKSCGLCRLQGHKIGSCPKITTHGHPLPSGNTDAASLARVQLFDTLAKPGYYASHFMVERELTLPVYRIAFPKDVRCIVFHRRLFKSSIFPFDLPSNYCFEATLLDTRGEVKNEFVKAFFELYCVNSFLSSSNRILVINNMQIEAYSTPTKMDTPPIHQGNTRRIYHSPIMAPDSQSTAILSEAQENQQCRDEKLAMYLHFNGESDEENEEVRTLDGDSPFRTGTL